MKLKRILAGALAGVMAMTSMVVTSVTVSAAADPVLPDVEYGTVKFEDEGEFTCTLKDDGSVEGTVAQLASALCYGSYVFEDDDILLISVTTDVEDTSVWKAAFNGFGEGWASTWTGVAPDAGVLSFSTTISEVAKASGLKDASELGGVLFQVWDAKEGDTFKYSVVLAEAPSATESVPSDIPDPVLPDVEYGTVKFEDEGEFTCTLKDDGSIEGTVAQLASALCYGNYVFEDDDILLISVTTNVEDTSAWKAAFNGFGEGWSSTWTGVAPDAGVLSFSATVGELAKATGLADASELGGVLFQVWDAKEGDTFKYSVVLAEAAEEEEEDEVVEEEEEEVLDKGTFDNEKGKYAELPADKIPAMTNDKDSVSADKFLDTKADTLLTYADGKLYIYAQYSTEKDLANKTEASVIVKHTNGKALKLTTSAAYNKLTNDIVAAEGNAFIAFVITGVSDSANDATYWGNFSCTDITLA